VESEETRLAHKVLATEYNVLMAALSAAWSTSLTRTSLFLGVLTAAGVGFAFASQGGMETSTLLSLSLLVLILVLFLGIATFIRLVEVQRESMVYITGMNRIRHFFSRSGSGQSPVLRAPYLGRRTGSLSQHWNRDAPETPEVSTPAPDSSDARHCGNRHRRGGRRLSRARSLTSRQRRGLVGCCVGLLRRAIR
jgi:hypothetical protein